MEYVNTEGNLLIWNCLKSKKYCNLEFYKKSRNKFVNTFNFCKGNLTVMRLLYQVEEVTIKI